MKTMSSADRLTRAGKAVFNAATELTRTTGVATKPIALITTALSNVADVLRHSERLDQPLAVAARLECALLLLGLDDCLSIREDMVEAMLKHGVYTEEVKP